MFAFQVTIAATNTPQVLPNNPFKGQIVLLTKSGNTASIEIGTASSVTTSTGAILAAGTSAPILAEGSNSNTNNIYIVGTMGDVLSVIGA
jgi:hypothetical protein